MGDSAVGTRVVPLCGHTCCTVVCVWSLSGILHYISLGECCYGTVFTPAISSCILGRGLCSSPVTDEDRAGAQSHCVRRIEG